MRKNSLRERVYQEGNPVIDGETATFIWEGQHAPMLVDDLHGWGDHPQALTRAGTHLWSISVRLPRDAYLEYKFWDANSSESILDPLNPNCVKGISPHYNNYFYMPEAKPTPLIKKAAGGLKGTVTRQRVETDELAAGRERTVYFYKPPVKEPVPLIVVYDGTDYLQQAKLAVMVDNLIAQKRIHPVALAMLHNGGQARNVEYGCSDSTIAFLLSRVLPAARRHLKLLDIKKNPGAFGVLGASMGGLMALYTSLRLPHIFGRVMSQSGAFDVWEVETVAMQMARAIPVSPIKIWMDCGKLEWLMTANRNMHKLLAEKGYDITYREFSGGHNYTAWRDSIWRGLELMFG